MPLSELCEQIKALDTAQNTIAPYLRESLNQAIPTPPSENK
ncbi:hypothetical protein P4S63_19810 [Pseudoalteromonas sp. B193]